jgi:hypothetical protein
MDARGLLKVADVYGGTPGAGDAPEGDKGVM